MAVGDDPDREGEPITAYIDLARAVLMAVLPTLDRWDWDGEHGMARDASGYYVKADDLEAILNEG